MGRSGRGGGNGGRSSGWGGLRFVYKNLEKVFLKNIKSTS